MSICSVISWSLDTLDRWDSCKIRNPHSFERRDKNFDDIKPPLDFPYVHSVQSSGDRCGSPVLSSMGTFWAYSYSTFNTAPFYYLDLVIPDVMTRFAYFYARCRMIGCRSSQVTSLICSRPKELAELICICLHLWGGDKTRHWEESLEIKTPSESKLNCKSQSKIWRKISRHTCIASDTKTLSHPDDGTFDLFDSSCKV